MLFKGSVFKLILGGLFTLGLTAAAGVVYMLYIKPYAPALVAVQIDTLGGSCQPVITFYDNSQNEDEFRVYRQDPNKPFILISIIHPYPGKGTLIPFSDTSLPPGTYNYQVSAKNQFGESGSELRWIVVSSSVLPMCDPKLYIDPSTLPLNPIIVSLSIINDCSVRISYRDNSTNEQGLKILRDEPYRDPTFFLVKTLGPHAGIPGTYDDNTKLPPGTYGYKIVAFNQNGESASNFPTIEVTSVCNPAMHALPTVDALIFPTAQKQSTESCIWEATANVFLRTGPDAGIYDRLIDEKSGATLPIVGQSEDGQFWAVEVSPGVIGYITKAEIYSRTSGDCSSVPTLKDPPPEIEATPTTQLGGNDNENPTPVPATLCPVGAVCP
jgi:hypothetical protein